MRIRDGKNSDPDPGSATLFSWIPNKLIQEIALNDEQKK
jgi:hypothetical protein